MRIPRGTLAVLAALALAASCTSSPRASTEPSALFSPRATNATKAPLLPTDRYELPEMDRGEFQQLLSQLKGTPVVVNFWASWCGPCREEAPLLESAARRFGTKVQFLGVDISDERDVARQTIQEFNWPYPSVFDPQEDIKSSFGLLGQPDTLFFDSRGERFTVDYKGTPYTAFSGPMRSQEQLDDAIRQLLAS